MKNITSTLFLVFTLFSLSTVFGQSTASYDISLTTIWNSTDHTSVPANAHWSPLAGATHKNLNDLLEFGETAPMTNGIKEVAETGGTTNFEAEVNAQITAGNADQYLHQGFSPFAGNNSNASFTNVSVSENFPLITLVSMVAPSPDWFIAINNLNLRSGNNPDSNGWENTFTINVFVYDAGTDDGTDYGSGNTPSSPRQPIAMVTGMPINGNRMATITFTLKNSTLSTNQINTLENIKLFPNPTKGKITLSNIESINLKSAKVYNVLGKLVKDIPIEKGLSKLNIDLSHLNKGVYLLSLKTVDNKNTTKKLVIN